MNKLVVAFAALSLLAGTPALAADKKKEEAPKAPQSMIVDTVALPVIVKNQLINYVFVSIRLELNPNVDGAAVRTKEQYIRDDLVRAGHRTPFLLPGTYAKLDEAKIKAEIMRYAPSVIGANAIIGIVITKQVSQKVRTLPPVDPAGGPPLIP